MANQILNIMAAVQPRPAVDFERQQVSTNEGPSFSKYIEQKSHEMKIDGKGLLGVKSSKLRETQVSERQSETIEEPKVSTEAELLQQIMFQLHDFANDKEKGAGQWHLPELDSDNLAMLAEAAGMDPAEFGILNLQMNEQKEVKPVLDLLNALEKHFSQLTTEIPVTAPETSLPLVQTILEKLGVSAEQVAGVTEKSVNDQGQFDLSILLEGLKKLGKEIDSVEIPLTEWETEQLQDMLSQAGLSKEMQGQLFPQSSAHLLEALQSLTGKDVESDVTPVLETTITLGQLKEMLEVTIADVDTAAPKADPAAFLGQLEDILEESGFKEKELGWTPVVQESIAAVFQELQRIIDQARVEIEKVSESFPEDRVIPEESLFAGKPVANDDLQANLLTGDKDPNQLNLPKENATKISPPQISPEMPYATLEQTIKDVLLALKNSQPQLTESLSPKELGEVKVDLQMRDGQLSVAFIMENQSAKDLLEGSLLEFRNSMEQSGFILGECTVSVDQVEESASLAMEPEIVDLLKMQQSTLAQISQAVLQGLKDGQQQLTVALSPKELGEVTIDLQQSTLAQISQAVLQGLKDSQQQLTVALSPKELGDVKIDLQVRDGQLPMAFLIGNSKVKELLEGSLGEFRNSMKEREFVFGEFTVSVDQNEESASLNMDQEIAAFLNSSGGSDIPVNIFQGKNQSNGERWLETNTLGSLQETGLQLTNSFSVGSESNPDSEVVDLKAGHSRLRMSSEMQQFTLDQLSQTVLRGLKNNQHQLTMTLYPKELGEVKVDIQVRDNQVSLSFLMENPKVKELLESNMQDFKNSLEQRGFVVQGCDVSVDQNNNGDKYQKQFELAKTWQSLNERRTGLAEITELLASGQGSGLPYHDGAINMMV